MHLPHKTQTIYIRSTKHMLLVDNTNYSNNNSNNIKMSVLPSRATEMAHAIRHGQHESAETFQKFFECWLAEQNQHLEELVSASKGFEQRHGGTEFHSNGHKDDSEVNLNQLIERVVWHYEQYYRIKSLCAKQDVLAMLSPAWRSSLEDAFLWIGGWRPSMAFHLLYSKSGLQLEARLSELIQGISTNDLGDLSPDQLNRVNELQLKTIREEKEMSEEMAKCQETVADLSMTQLSNEVSELIRNNEANPEDISGNSARVDSVLKPKEDLFEERLQKADDLRLRTLKGVLDILTPIQAVHFLVAAAELHLRLHEWGKNKDA